MRFRHNRIGTFSTLGKKCLQDLCVQIKPVLKSFGILKLQQWGLVQGFSKLRSCLCCWYPISVCRFQSRPLGLRSISLLTCLETQWKTAQELRPCHPLGKPRWSLGSWLHLGPHLAVVDIEGNEREYGRYLFLSLLLGFSNK